MARLGRLERPTSGSGEHGNVLTRYENIGLYYIRLAVTTTLAWLNTEPFQKLAECG